MTNSTKDSLSESIKKRSNGILTRKNILREATRLMAEQGPQGVKIGSIVDRIGLTRRAFYHHFNSREALMDAVTDNMELQLEQVLKEFETDESPFLVFALTAAISPVLIQARLSDSFSRNAKGNQTLKDIHKRFEEYQSKGLLRKNVDIEMASLLAISCWYGALMACSNVKGKKKRIEAAKRYAAEYESTFREGLFTL